MVSNDPSLARRHFDSSAHNELVAGPKGKMPNSFSLPLFTIPSVRLQAVLFTLQHKQYWTPEAGQARVTPKWLFQW